MSNDQLCLFEDQKSYDQHRMALVLGTTPDWVIENVFKEGCPFRKLGRRYVTTGLLINRWITDGGEYHGSYEVQGVENQRA